MAAAVASLACDPLPTESAPVSVDADAGITSTSMTDGPLLPGPGKVINMGRSAATQSPCTAPAPSTQSGRVMERRSVKAAASVRDAPVHAFARDSA